MGAIRKKLITDSWGNIMRFEFQRKYSRKNPYLYLLWAFQSPAPVSETQLHVQCKPFVSLIPKTGLQKFYVFKVDHVWTICFHFRWGLRNNSLKENNSSYYNNMRCYFFLSTKSYIQVKSPTFGRSWSSASNGGKFKVGTFTVVLAFLLECVFHIVESL